MRFALSAAFIALLSSPIITAYGKEDSKYVSLQANSCRIPDGSITDHYHSRDLEVSECLTEVTVQSALLRLFVVSTNERSWIDLALGNTIWSSEDEVAYEKENQFGYFPNVGKAPAEIRINDTGVAVGLIFRVTAQAFDQTLFNLGDSNISRLFVLGFKEAGVCFLGIARNNNSARKLLDTDVSCRRMLKSEQFH